VRYNEGRRLAAEQLATALHRPALDGPVLEEVLDRIDDPDLSAAYAHYLRALRAAESAARAVSAAENRARASQLGFSWGG